MENTILENIDINDFVKPVKENNVFIETTGQKLLREHCETILSEAYFGKHPLLRQCELELKTIIKRVKYNPMYNATDSKENQNICRNLEKLFNVESCSLVWSTDNTSANAFTIPISQVFQFDNDLKTVRTSTGVKFAKSKGIHLFITVLNGYITNIENVNEEMLMATILHEIGHNFYNTDYIVGFNKYLGTLNMISIIVEQLSKTKDMNTQLILQNTLSLYLFKSNSGRKNFKNVIDDKNNSSKVYKVTDLVASCFQLYNYVDQLSKKFKNISNIFSYHKRNTTFYMMNFVGHLVNKRHEQERFSDTFASMYGYSSVVIQKRIDFDSTTNTDLLTSSLKAIKPLQFIMVYFNALYSAPLRLLSPYDDGLQSAKSQIEYLEKELKNTGYSPALRKELQKQLEVAKKLEKYAASPKHSIESANIFRLLLHPITKGMSLNKGLNKSTYFLTGREFDASFEGIIDKEQVI